MNHDESIEIYSKALNLINDVSSLETDFIKSVNKKQEKINEISEELKTHGFYVLSDILNEAVLQLKKKTDIYNKKD